MHNNMIANYFMKKIFTALLCGAVKLIVIGYMFRESANQSLYDCLRFISILRNS